MAPRSLNPPSSDDVVAHAAGVALAGHRPKPNSKYCGTHSSPSRGQMRRARRAGRAGSRRSRRPRRARRPAPARRAAASATASIDAVEHRARAATSSPAVTGSAPRACSVAEERAPGSRGRCCRASADPCAAAAPAARAAAAGRSPASRNWYGQALNFCSADSEYGARGQPLRRQRRARCAASTPRQPVARRPARLAARPAIDRPSAAGTRSASAGSARGP